MSGSRTESGMSQEEKRRLLAQLLQKKAAEPKTFPVSFSQRRFWFLDQLEPGNPVYNIALTHPLPGEWDPEVATRAVQEIVRRHGALRTVFRTVDGEPVQHVLPALHLPVAYADLSGLPPAERDAEIRRRIAANASAPFSLHDGPLMRCTLLRLAPGEHLLLRCVHHIVADGWSNGVFQQEFHALYAAFAAGQPSPLPPLPIQYGDFAAWQREQMSGATLEAQLAYWREHLAGAPELLEIPTDRPRPATQQYEGAVQHHVVPSLAADALNTLSREEGATLFMTLMAAFALLLGRYAGQDQVVLGTPIAGRTRPETEPLIGFFVNTLVIRTDLSGDPTFRELLRRVRAATVGAYGHQEMPFDKLVDDLGTERSLAHSPLFQVMFTLQSVLGRVMEAGGAPEKPRHGEASVAAQVLGGVGTEKRLSMFDMSLNTMETDDGLQFSLEYRSDLWEPDTILRLVAQYGVLLERLGQSPDVPLSRVSVLLPQERHYLLHKLNATAVDFPAASSLAAMFEAQADRTPSAVAVTFRGVSLSYAELDARATRLAHHLRRLGVGPDVRVGVSVERSVEMTVAVLAVLKAGGCYVAMDPAYPAERLAYMLRGSRAPVLLTMAHLADRLPHEGAVVLRLDADWGRIEEESTERFDGGASADSLAYVLYTSGSTGQPKGVALPQRALVNLLHWQLGRWAGQAPARTLQFASLSFDVSFQEMFATWCSGGTLVLVDDETRKDGEALFALLRDERVERLFLPFAALQHLAEVAEESGIDGVALREIITAGEQLRSTPALRRLVERTGCVLENQYGPTESHVVSAFAMPAETAGWAALPPIGTPIANTQLFILDAALQPVPVGVFGELYIAGACLARGYLDRPELTAERFVPNPYGAAGSRMYRTGDRVRLQGDGEIHFLGRIDHQVKVRGFRIELGEIEAVLQNHPRVSEAVVVVREDAPGDRRVVAYVAPGEGEHVDAAELREHLRAHVPDFMVPSAVVVMDRLPLSPNGKVERRALPAPERTEAADAYQPPRTPTEELMAAIWGDVLGVERVGRTENFFDLGGHSLLATRVVSRIRAALETELPVRVLFEAPTLAELAARVDALGRVEDAAPPVVRVPRDRPLPLSFMQERLWFVDRLVPGSAAYNLPLVLPVPAAEPALLERALAEIVRRHEALRTTFTPTDDGVVQTVHPAGGFALATEELGGLPQEELARVLPSLLADETGRPFDLQTGPLFRARLFRLGAEGQLLALTMHHAVGDGWSWDVLTRELTAIYAAFERGEGSPLPELAVQYADFAVWQREHLTGDVLERQLAYWRERLAGAPALLELPTDRPRPATETFQGAVQSFVVPRRVADGVRALGRREGATLFMTLFAAFNLVLRRWSGQDDVVVGSPIAGRTRREAEGLIGFFVNNLVLRTDLAGDPSFRELLGRVRETTLGAYAHQELPFEKLVEELRVERSLGHSPLFQVLFNLLNTAASPAGAGVPEPEETGPSAPQPRPSKFDLTVEVNEVGGALTVGLEYSTELFEHATVTRLARHFRALLEEVVTRPDAPLSAFTLVDGEERARLVDEWSGRATEYPRDTSVPALFAQVAASFPDATAVTAHDATLTYAELNERANRLARHLRSVGVGPGSRVGLSLPRSSSVPVALLAILKAGAAYVPLDASYPAARLVSMAEDAELRVLVVADELPAALASFAGTVVSLVSDRRMIDAESSDDLDGVPVGPDSLAYVVFTSGSTGRPKGVAVPHRAILRLVRGTDYAEFGPSDVILQLAPVAFDASTLEVWGPLLNGGRMAIHPPETPSLEELGRFLREQEVTTAWLTAGLFHQMVDAQLDSLRGLRQLLAGGDVLSVPHVRRAMEALPGTRIVNGYGPTENTTFTCCHTVRAEDVERASIPIGRPIANTRVYVLDAAMQPVPVGVPGELYAGGDGVALGYLGQPELTAERFVADPFSTDGGKLYRTGDRVRWLADGTIEFLGRIDQQVKVRGFRIEPGEIEAALAEHPEVREAAVVVREDVPGDRRLVAYVVASAEVDEAALRGHLRTRLPEYMVPQAFVRMEALPLTPNGKVDRKALPAPEATGEAGAYVAPRTATEQALAAIWSEVLNVPRVSADAGFFELGGHSLLATRIVSRIRQGFGVELPLRALFEASVLAELAARIDEARGETTADDVPLLVPVPRDGPLPLSFAQERLWFVDRLVPGNPAYNVPLALPVPGADPALLERALGEIVRRHEALRTTFAAGDDGAVQVIHPAGDFPLEVVDLSGLPVDERDAEVGRRLAAEYARRFELERGPLFRATLVRAGEGEQLLLLNTHHIVSDGWSTDVLKAELTTLYEAFARGAESPLPPLPVQYADFAVWQRAYLAGDVLERQLAFWREQLRGAPALLELPTDRPRPAVQGHAGSTVPVALPKPAADALAALATREGATPFMALLAAFSAVLGRWAGQTDVVVGSPIAGRNRAEIEGLVGFFVNNLVLRTDLGGDPSFRELVRRARETTLAAYAHQDVPFERLVEELRVERSLSHTPLFQVMFVLQNTGGAGTAPADAPVPPTDGMEEDGGGGGVQTGAKFDLTLNLAESQGGLVGSLEYSTDLFDRATARRIVRHFRTLLEAMVAQPDAPLSRLSMLPPSERAQTDGWRATAPAVVAAPVHRLFAAQAARTPDATALVFGADSVTYAELDARANRLAHHLVRLGVGPDVPVAISLERSPEMVVALLATLKAGGAYLPVDPTYPVERRAYMLADSGAPVLLTRSALVAGLPASEATVVVLDELSLDGAVDGDGESAEAPSVDVDADHLAYVIYTSGSTGRPKGVMVTHRGIPNLAAAQVEGFGIGAGSRVLQFASFSFDAAVSEVTTALVAGATLVLAPQDELMPGAPLTRTLREQRVTVATLPPSALAVMEETEFPTLRTLVSAGEAVAAELVTKWSGDGRLFINAYGPTETTVCAAMALEEDGSRRPSIGRPIAGLRVHVLDAAGQPAGVGVPGEICVGGIGLARGYLRRPALTAERFVPDAFSGEAGARLYRTGDRGRWLADGTLEYLGRLDDQVKVRGFRIETGEVEAALRALDGVDDAVVVAREDVPGDRRLVGYVVPASTGEVDAAALREALRATLPEYMVPSALVSIEALPLTPNGKVDRKGLPAPEGTADAAAYVAPRTATEVALAEVWRELLRVERVGAGDGFFALGGHSLVATRLVSRIRQSLGVEIPLRTVFEAPVLADLAARVDAARAEATTDDAPPLVPVPRDGALPLSFAQERLWFVHRLAELGAAYNIPLVLPVGDADPEVLERALGEVVRRHEALRTTFILVDGRPVQVVHPAGGFRLARVDMTALTEDEKLRLAPVHIGEETGRPFDLERGPLFRAALFDFDGGDQVLAVTLHHTVGDGWSVALLKRELAALYHAFAAGEASPLPELPVQYADFAVWQREHLTGDVLERQLAYWRERLAGAPELLELPTDRPRPPVQSFRGASRTVLLPREDAARLTALARAEGSTAFAALLAGFSALLGRWAGQDDVVVGSTVAGRTRAETEGLIGFFVNNLVLRVDLSADPTFRELVRQARETALGAYAHQDVPFERLVEALRVERSLSHTPLFQVLFNLLTEETGADTEATLPEDGADGAGEWAKYDLTLSASETEQGVALSLNYNTDLFDAATIRRMTDQLRTLLRAAATHPDCRLSDLALLDEAERTTVVHGWNAATARPDYARGVRVHDLFAAQAARTPDAVALVFGDEEWTYAEVDARSNRLARRLQSLGVGPDVPVAVCMERRPEMVVALLAVLKAGGAYVPVDPAYPAERIAVMLEDTGAPVVLVNRGAADRLPSTGATTVDVDAESARIAALDASPVDSAASAENLAYVIYTSGSTGRPKGVAIEHRNTAVVVQWMREAVSDAERRAVLGSTSISFDVSVAEIFGTLSWGGTLVLVENALSLPEVKREITCASMVPSAAAELLRMGAIPSSVRTLFLGGEPLPPALARGLHALGTVQRVGNLYGPTEDTTYSTFSLVAPDAARVLVGRPVANTQAYVLDRHLHPVPVGVPGELYLAGDGVTRGYFRRPGLTAERYLPNPFDGNGGGRMYRVGDRVRWLPGGELEYLGRIDQQVKVRGFRIETGEIEAALAAHLSVSDAAVVAREGAAGDLRLVAYVVPRGDGIDAAELRAHLRARLPEYMVPSALVALDALPQTPNGKTDRRALPAPTWDGEAATVAPRDATERALVAIWEEVLGVAPVGVRDSFFERGGHSLLAVRMTTLVRERLGRELPLAVLFGGATVEHVAAVLRADVAASDGPLVPIRTGGSRPPLFLVHGAAGSVLRFAALGRAAHPEQPLYALRALGLETGETPLETVEEMAATYLEAVRRVQPAGPYHLAGWSMGAAVALEMARQLRVAGETVAPLLLLDGQSPTLPGDAAPDEAALLATVAGELGRPLPADLFATLDADDGEGRLHAALEWINAAGPVLPAGDPEPLRRLVGTLRASFGAWHRYRPAGYDGPVLLFQAAERIADDRARTGDPAAGDFLPAWRAVAPAARSETVPGGHYTLSEGANSVTLWERIEAAMEAGSDGVATNPH